MSDLTTFRDHCQRMAEAQHRLDCLGRMEDRWGFSTVHPDPKCGGCLTDSDRALFARLAAEVNDYLDPHPTHEEPT